MYMLHNKIIILIPSGCSLTTNFDVKYIVKYYSNIFCVVRGLIMLTQYNLSANISQKESFRVYSYRYIKYHWYEGNTLWRRQECKYMRGYICWCYTFPHIIWSSLLFWNATTNFIMRLMCILKRYYVIQFALIIPPICRFWACNQYKAFWIWNLLQWDSSSWLRKLIFEDF